IPDDFHEAGNQTRLGIGVVFQVAEKILRVEFSVFIGEGIEQALIPQLIEKEMKQVNFSHPDPRGPQSMGERPNQGRHPILILHLIGLDEYGSILRQSLHREEALAGEDREKTVELLVHAFSSSESISLSGTRNAARSAELRPLRES